MANKTRAGLEAQIANDLIRADLAVEIGEAVETAINAYENERFWFNEAYRVTATLSISAATVALSAMPSRFLLLDRVRLLRSTNNFIDLYPRDYAWIMARQDAVTYTQPAEYCVYGEFIQFDTFANQAYTLYCDGIKSLGNSATASDSYTPSSSVAWFTDARELIRHRAKLEIYAHVIKDFELAGASAAAEYDALNALKARTSRLTGTGLLRPTEF